MASGPDLGAAAVVRTAGAIPERLAALGIVVTGVIWSVGSLAAHWSAVEAAGLPLIQSIILIMLGGMAAALAVWFGIGAVTWAMTRALRGNPGFTRVLLIVSAATPPLWLAAPPMAFLLAGDLTWPAAAPLGATVVIGSVLFLALLAAGLRNAAGFSSARAWGCIGLIVMFCGSFLSLHR